MQSLQIQTSVRSSVSQYLYTAKLKYSRWVYSYDKYLFYFLIVLNITAIKYLNPQSGKYEYILFIGIKNHIAILVCNIMKFIIGKFCWQCSWVISHCLLPVSVWPAVLGHWTSVPKRPNSVDFFVIPELKSPSLSLILPCFQVSEPTQYIITITKRVYASMIINWPAIQK